jgi:ribosomal protein S27E
MKKGTKEERLSAVLDGENKLPYVVVVHPSGFDDEFVASHFGESSYIGSSELSYGGEVWRWYVAWSPDQSKDHKDFFGINPGGSLITGRNWDSFQKILNVDAIHCPDCNEVNYSQSRHDMRFCSCGKTFADGGRAYMRSTVYGTGGKLNLLTRVFTASRSRGDN